MEQPKVPAQPVPWREPAPPVGGPLQPRGSSLSEPLPTARNARGPEGRAAPQPEPFTTGRPSFAGDPPTLTVNAPKAGREIAERLGSLGKLSFGSEGPKGHEGPQQVASIGDIVSASRRTTNY
jgi:hypothetical protein